MTDFVNSHKAPYLPVIEKDTKRVGLCKGTATVSKIAHNKQHDTAVHIIASEIVRE